MNSCLPITSSTMNQPCSWPSRSAATPSARRQRWRRPEADLIGSRCSSSSLSGVLDEGLRAPGTAASGLRHRQVVGGVGRRVQRSRRQQEGRPVAVRVMGTLRSCSRPSRGLRCLVFSIRCRSVVGLARILLAAAAQLLEVGGRGPPLLAGPSAGSGPANSDQRSRPTSVSNSDSRSSSAPAYQPGASGSAGRCRTWVEISISGSVGQSKPVGRLSMALRFS